MDVWGCTAASRAGQFIEQLVKCIRRSLPDQLSICDLPVSCGTNCDGYLKLNRQVEEVDIYPSLIAMHWGASAVPAELEGTSFVPLLQLGHEQAKGKPRVFSQYPHSLTYGAAIPAHGHHANVSGSVMGYSMRTPTFRYHLR